MTLMLSAFFAGISGGLSAINFEIVSAENVSAIRSGLILLFTFIGGVGFFFGPILGAIVGVFLTVILSNYTNAWQLYLGVFFVLIVMFAPGGIAGVIMQIVRLQKYGQFTRLLPQLAMASLFLLLIACGFVMMVEMLYHLTMDAEHGSVVSLFGWMIDAERIYGWLAVSYTHLTLPTKA